MSDKVTVIIRSGFASKCGKHDRSLTLGLVFVLDTAPITVGLVIESMFWVWEGWGLAGFTARCSKHLSFPSPRQRYWLFTFFLDVGGMVKSWKRRWFVLKSNGFLYYYETANCKSEKGKIDVISAGEVSLLKKEVAAASSLPSNLSPSNSFSVVSGGRTYICVCDSSDDARWEVFSCIGTDSYFW